MEKSNLIPNQYPKVNFNYKFAYTDAAGNTQERTDDKKKVEPNLCSSSDIEIKKSRSIFKNSSLSKNES